MRKGLKAFGREIGIEEYGEGNREVAPTETINVCSMTDGEKARARMQLCCWHKRQRT